MLENGKVKMKIGDGVTAWSNLAYFGGAENHVYVGELGESETANAAIERLVGAAELNAGDMAILKKPIYGDKYEYTAYVYNEGAWQAMDGNYDAENVYFAKDLVITADIGVQKIDAATGSKTLNIKGKNAYQVLDLITSEEKNPTKTLPDVIVTLTNPGAKEVGSKFTPNYAVTFKAGSYQFGPATGIVATAWEISDSNGNTGATASGKFDEFTIDDNTSYKVTAKATYSEGAIPVTNKDNPYPAGKIPAGSVTKSSAAVTGYRNMFAGSKTTQDAAFDSAIIRALGEKRAAGAVNDWAITVVEGAKEVVVAVPTGYRVTKVLDVGAFGTDIVASFVKQTVAVEGANGYTAKNYDVYVYKPAAALGANTYKVTIA